MTAPLRSTPSTDRALATLLRAEHVQPPRRAIAPLGRMRRRRPLGSAETGSPVGLSIEQLLGGRLLVQGASGAGKS